MRVDTKAYGSIDIDERQRIEFPYGILGFEKLHSYVLLDAPQQPFYWLQSLDVLEVAFVLINPVIFRPDYTVEVPREELEEIGIDDPDKLLTFAIVTIPQNPAEMTANLQGPLLINKETRVGRQSICLDPKWEVRHPVLKELAAVREDPC